MSKSFIKSTKDQLDNYFMSFISALTIDRVKAVEFVEITSFANTKEIWMNSNYKSNFIIPPCE